LVSFLLFSVLRLSFPNFSGLKTSIVLLDAAMHLFFSTVYWTACWFCPERKRCALPEIHSDFGWLAFIATPLYFALRFVHAHVVGNWGWTIILVTAVFNLLLLWPRMMAMRSSLKMMRMQPSVDALRKRYGDLKINDPKRTEMQTEMMALYKAEGTNMYGSCLPMLLQMPLLFGYMRVLRNAVELHHAGWLWLTDLAVPDPLHILPLLILGLMLLTQLLTPMPGMNPRQRKMMAVLMPLVMGFSLWGYPSGLALYWATGNLISLGFQLAIHRSRIGKEMRAVAAERSGKG
jgi:YidC/Oxa1 family membrane protein insertase